MICVCVVDELGCICKFSNDENYWYEYVCDVVGEVLGMCFLCLGLFYEVDYCGELGIGFYCGGFDD